MDHVHRRRQTDPSSAPHDCRKRNIPSTHLSQTKGQKKTALSDNVLQTRQYGNTLLNQATVSADQILRQTTGKQQNCQNRLPIRISQKPVNEKERNETGQTRSYN